tara:strand:- start:11 stop:226 length:216 start_codon:yes stop_codon:yes gene_type:complete
MERDGKPIGTDADKLRKRRLADARNAIRKMDAAQLDALAAWVVDEGYGDAFTAALSGLPSAESLRQRDSKG